MIHDDVRGEQHGLADVDGDGLPEIFGACLSCGERKGYYVADWANPSKKWAFHAVTTPVEFPYGGTGWLSGFGFGRVNADTTPDFLERNGIWLDPLAAEPSPSSFIQTPLHEEGLDGASYDHTSREAFGPSHLQVFDVDGDGDSDIVGAENSKNYGLSWYEQTAEGVFTKHTFPSFGDPGAFSSPQAIQIADMDGDGVPDLITGKMRYPLPQGCGIPDLEGDPVNYVFKTLRNTPDVAHGGPVTFEAHPIEVGNDKVGIGRQIAVGHANTDGVMDVCVGTKLGLYVFLGQ